MEPEGRKIGRSRSLSARRSSSTVACCLGLEVSDDDDDDDAHERVRDMLTYRR